MQAHAIRTTRKIARAAWAGSLALALSGCYETVGGDCTQPFAATSNLADHAPGKC